MMPMEQAYHRWQALGLNKQHLIRVMAMIKQYKLEKHLAKHYNRYEVEYKSL